MVVIGLGTLAAGVVGVSNIMMIAVKERTKEIGVRKALGATPRSIVFMIIQEAVFLTGVAGLLGLVGGVAFLELRRQGRQRLHPQPVGRSRHRLIATAFLVLAGALAGYFPARAAASTRQPASTRCSDESRSVAMFDLDKWKEIWATLRSNRLRTFLTAFGVFWGILMLMAMLGFGSSIQTGSKRQMKGMATNLLFVWGQQTTEAYDGLPPGRGVQFDTDDIEILRRLPAIEYLAPRLQLGGWMNNFTVSYESKTGTFTVMADYPELQAHHRVRLRGRPVHQRARHRRASARSP